MGAPWNYSVVIQVFGRGTRLSSEPNRTINLLQIVDDSIVSKNPHLISLAKERAQRVMFGELEKPITLDAMKKEYNTTYSGALSNPIAQFLRSKQKSLRIKNIIPTELLFSHLAIKTRVLLLPLLLKKNQALHPSLRPLVHPVAACIGALCNIIVKQ